MGLVGLIAPLGLVVLAVAAALPLAIHVGFRAPRRRERGTPAALGLPFETVNMPTMGGARLFGWLLPVPGAGATVLVLHGWGGNAELMLPLALPLHRAGVNVLLFDARNHDSIEAIDHHSGHLIAHLVEVGVMPRPSDTTRGRLAL